MVRRNVKRLRGGLVVKARRLVYHSTLGLRAIKKKRRDGNGLSAQFGQEISSEPSVWRARQGNINQIFAILGWVLPYGKSMTTLK